MNNTGLGFAIGTMAAYIVALVAITQRRNIDKAHFRIFKGEDAQWYWNLKSNNNEIIAQSEGYQTKQNAERAIKMVMSKFNK